MPFTVARDATPPVVTVDALVDGTDVDLTWSATDTGSGVSHYDVDVREDAAWTAWLTQTTQTSATYDGDLARSYTFRVTATVPLRFASGMLR